MRYRNVLRFAAPFLLALVVIGCQSDDATAPSASGLQASIVPGADFVMRVDFRAMKESPVLENLEAQEAAAAPPPNDRWAKFIETTGLGAESLQVLLVSMDLESIDLGPNASRDDQMAAASAVLGVSLDTELTHEDIVAGVEAANADSGKAVAAIDETGSARLVKIQVQEETGTQVVYAAPSSEGDTVYFSMNAASVQGALDREASGAVESIPPSLEAAETALASNAQVRMAFLAPPSWRAKIREQIDGSAQSGGMAAGMLSPLKDLQSIAMGMAFDTDLQVQLVGDLGNEEAAQQASAFLQMMVVPMIQSALSENGGGGAGDKLEVGVQGTVLQLGMSFTEADIAAFREKASSMGPPAGIGGIN